MTDEIQQAWAAVHVAPPDGWYLGRPSEHPERREWVMFAFDTRERPIEGKREGEWTTVAPSEPEVVRSRPIACASWLLAEVGHGNIGAAHRFFRSTGLLRE